jgi:hypothetical protein
MATADAIATVTAAIVQHLLRAIEATGRTEIDVKAGSAGDLATPESGVTVVLHHVSPDQAVRVAPGRGATVPLVLRYLVVPRGGKPLEQQGLLGTVATALAAHPVLTSDDLAAVTPGVFGPEERVELSFESVPPDALVPVWRARPELRQPCLVVLARPVVLSAAPSGEPGLHVVQ